MKLIDINTLTEKVKHSAKHHHTEGTHVVHSVSGEKGVVNGKHFIGMGVGWYPVLAGRGAQTAWRDDDTAAEEGSESASTEAGEDGGGAPPGGGGDAD
jgi:hypothetical protein